MLSSRRAAISFAVLVLAAPAAAAFADETSTPPNTSAPPAVIAATSAPSTTPGPRRPRRTHCETDRSTGTFIAHRTCYTDEEWEARRVAAEEERRRYEERMATCNRGTSSTAC